MAMNKLSIAMCLPLACIPFSSLADTQKLSEINQGEYLARAGDCVACHSTPGGKPFAGGLKMSTPVGAIYSTNITPDPRTGIGQYSYNDFAKALRQGIAKDGHHLYPAMPYTAFAKINDQDMHALYAYFLYRVSPVEQENRQSDIPWPLNMRWPLAVWNWAFHDTKMYQQSSRQSEQWNRGAYLVQGLGHCGTCHTPRGLAFQEKALDDSNTAYLTGGTIEGWHAPNLTANQHDGLGRWSSEEIKSFLQTGRTAKSAAFGSMAAVIANSTQYLSNADAEAIAVYLKSLPASEGGTPIPARTDTTTAALIKGDVSTPGAQEYMDNCAACHRINGQGYTRTFPALAGNSVIMSDDPASLISIVLQGGKMPVTQQAITPLAMPDFAWRLDDQQIANVVTFIRNSWGNQASSVSTEQVKKLRALTTQEEKSTQSQRH